MRQAFAGIFNNTLVGALVPLRSPACRRTRDQPDFGISPGRLDITAASFLAAIVTIASPGLPLRLVVLWRAIATAITLVKVAIAIATLPLPLWLISPPATATTFIMLAIIAVTIAALPLLALDVVPVTAIGALTLLTIVAIAIATLNQIPALIFPRVIAPFIFRAIVTIAIATLPLLPVISLQAGAISAAAVSFFIFHVTPLAALLFIISICHFYHSSLKM
jgi:hypothetical protein